MGKRVIYVCDRCMCETEDGLITIGTWADFRLPPPSAFAVMYRKRVEDETCRVEMCKNCFRELKNWLRK